MPPASPPLMPVFGGERKKNKPSHIPPAPATKKPRPVNGRMVFRSPGSLVWTPSSLTDGKGSGVFWAAGSVLCSGLTPRTYRMTTNKDSSDATMATAKTIEKLDAVKVNRRPAAPLPSEPATLLAVEYQAKAEAMDFLLPCSAISASTEGSRIDLDIPCTDLATYSRAGIPKNASISGTTIRSPTPAMKPCFSPTRSANHPESGFKARETERLTDIKTPMAARLNPR